MTVSPVALERENKRVNTNLLYHLGNWRQGDSLITSPVAIPLRQFAIAIDVIASENGACLVAL